MADGKQRPVIAPGCTLPLRADLPPELAFIPASVASPAVLARAVRRARELGVSPERVVLTEGVVSLEAYYRLLAAHLGTPFAEHPLRAASSATIEAVLNQGVLPLAPNRFGWRALLAPTGALLGAMLRREHRTDGRAFAITSPARLEALIRHDRRASVARIASDGLADWNRALSARGGCLSVRQRIVLGAMAASAGTLCWLSPPAGSDLLALLFSLAFLLAVVVRLAATAVSPPAPAMGPSHPVKRQRTSVEAVLPVYSVVVPLYREAREVRRLIAALDRLDYPRAKLDILLVLEANDRATLEALERLTLPACYRVLMAPAGRPKTKPRALNVALQFARGAFLVVYDAEDEPEPAQLRDAVAAFAAAPDVACLQAQLAIDNWKDSWLTRMFAIEYAALFHVVNPGLAALRWPVPLGGTSNHFRGIR